MTYKEYVTQFIGRKGCLTLDNAVFLIGGPEYIDVLTEVHDNFVVIKGDHEYTIPLSIFIITNF